MKSRLGERSMIRLETCHVDLITLGVYVSERSPVDFGIMEGARSDEKQLEYFLTGKSMIDPRNPELRKKGKHLYTPSRAFDFYVYIRGRRDLAYDQVHMAFLGGFFRSCALDLLERGKMKYDIRWGANWDRDGLLLHDQSLDDMPHIELIGIPENG